MEMHRADGVFQGGGIKGLALAGALLEFQNSTAHPHNYVEDWVQLAGTSAGAIVAAYLACGHSAADTAALIERTDFTQFEDWGPGGKLLGAAVNMARNHGLARGQVFLDWFRAQIGDQTFGDVHTANRNLKLIATDISRREMLVLPDSLSEYGLSEDSPRIDPESFPIADAVRMSMSIPYFFPPIELMHSETGRSLIVDGGVLSNFPVWIFDAADHDPLRPTFGFKLVSGKVGGGLGRITNALGWPLKTGVDIFHTATDAWDKFWVRHSTYVRTCSISAGDIGTTEFALSDERKRWLLESGRKAAAEFLEGWKSADYVNSHDRSLA